MAPEVQAQVNEYKAKMEAFRTKYGAEAATQLLQETHKRNPIFYRLVVDDLQDALLNASGRGTNNGQPVATSSPSPSPSPVVAPSPSLSPSPVVAPSPSPLPSPVVAPSPRPVPVPSPSPAVLLEASTGETKAPAGGDHTRREEDVHHQEPEGGVDLNSGRFSSQSGRRRLMAGGTYILLTPIVDPPWELPLFVLLSPCPPGQTVRTYLQA